MDADQEELERLRKDLERKNRIIDRLGNGDGSHYSEGSSSWQKWILGILGAIAVAGIVGGVEMNAQLAAIHQQQLDAILASDDRRREIDRRLESIEQKLSQRAGP